MCVYNVYICKYFVIDCFLIIYIVLIYLCKLHDIDE